MTKRRFFRRNKKSSNTIPWRLNWPQVLLVLLGLFVLVVVILAIWSFYLDKVVREKFEGKKWALPARVYSRPLELYAGLPLTPALFEQEMEALG